MERDVLSLLNEKIDGLLSKYEQANKTIETLKEELANIYAKKEELEVKNSELQEELALKDLELEEIVGKIESILGK